MLGQAAHLWTRTDLRPRDVDLALVYDGFTFNAVSWIEALGFCALGEAQDWLDGGRRIALDGELPVNPHGGQLSEGRTHGFGFIYEAVKQLRHEAGDRQVADADDRSGHHRGRDSVGGPAPAAGPGVTVVPAPPRQEDRGGDRQERRGTGSFALTKQALFF